MSLGRERMGRSNDSVAPRPADRAGVLRELAWVFLKLGTIGFGGPAAHVALMEDEVVRRRGWVSRADFLDLLAATNLIPGPNSTEMAIHLGHRRAGMPGLVLAGACFILPATLIVTAAAWSYTRFGAYPQAEAALRAIQPVIVAVIVQALWGLGRTALRTRWLGALAATGLAAHLLGMNELFVLAFCGAAAGLAHAARARPPSSGFVIAFTPTPLLGTLGVAAVPAGMASFGLWPMFLVFVKVGSVLFGSGYVLLAFLRGDLVQRLGWLTEQQLLDAVAIGQFTPGPLFTTATFIGYLLAGLPGAAVATAGIFLPAFIFVAISGPVVPMLRRSALAGAVLDGVIVASLAIMASVTLSLARVAIVDWTTAALALVAAVLLIHFRTNSAWLVLAAGLLGAGMGVGSR
jgi:chromate transporter